LRIEMRRVRSTKCCGLTRNVARLLVREAAKVVAHGGAMMFGKKNPALPPSKTGGPVVKTGPTRGDNRSRNEDGRWRGKRSDSGQSRSKKSGCFLTTAACEWRGLADDCHELEILRQFRDERLMASAKGRALVRQYYAVAPKLVQHLSDLDLQQVWRVIQRCVRLLERGAAGAAQREYQSMVARMLAERS
jgi:hypothetical protein